MLKLNIKKKLEEKEITRYELAKRIGVTYPTITSIYNGESTSIKLEILESLCCELNCTPNDILISNNECLNKLLPNHFETQKPKIIKTCNIKNQKNNVPNLSYQELSFTEIEHIEMPASLEIPEICDLSNTSTLEQIIQNIKSDTVN